MEEELELINDFVLPNAWYVICTVENRELLENWRFNKQSRYSLLTGTFVGMYRTDDSVHHNNLIDTFYKGHTISGNPKGVDYDFGIQITTEQFIKYVLKEEVIIIEKPIKTIELGKEKTEVSIYKNHINIDGVDFIIDDIKELINEYEKINLSLNLNYENSKQNTNSIRQD